jgi:hypothetical protein
MRPDDVTRCHQIGQSVMLDNGAYSKWKSGKETNWNAYYDWCEKWLAYPTTWAVIPDVIDEGSQVQDAMIKEWPFRDRGAPVWHMDEPLDRLARLVDEHPKVCFGSTAEYAVVLSEAWERRTDEAFNRIANKFTPWIHMLRGMQTVGRRWPFASVDSTDIGQNHHRDQNTPRKMADRWDAMQCPGKWEKIEEQEGMI